MEAVQDGIADASSQNSPDSPQESGGGGGSGGVLDFEVVPETALRNEHLELLIGMPINQLIVALQNSSRFVKSVDLLYCNREPFEKDITITLRNEGIRLYFEPKFQLLKLIEVFDFKNISLHYCSNVFSTPSEPANVARVESCFGATHPGVYDTKQKMYILNWRGVSFCFPAKEPLSTIQPSYAHGLGSLSFASSSLPLLERMTIFSNKSTINHPRHAAAGLAPHLTTPIIRDSHLSIRDIPASAYCGNIIGESLSSKLNESGRVVGLKIVYLAEVDAPTPGRKSELARCEKTICFGDTEGSVQSALGAPSKIYYKSADEKMLIQRSDGDSANVGNADQPDFFYNYLTLGLDILFDFNNRRVLKFVLHTNVPGHFDFAIYHRANFTIDVHKGTQKYTIRTDSKLEDFQSLFSSALDDEDESNGDDDNSASATAAKSAALDNRPVILNKCASASDGENPFGSSFCYGTDQVIVELMDNSHIASVVLFNGDKLA